jgi:hypothetical protein
MGIITAILKAFNILPEDQSADAKIECPKLFLNLDSGIGPDIKIIWINAIEVYTNQEYHYVAERNGKEVRTIATHNIKLAEGDR